MVLVSGNRLRLRDLYGASQRNYGRRLLKETKKILGCEKLVLTVQILYDLGVIVRKYTSKGGMRGISLTRSFYSVC